MTQNKARSAWIDTARGYGILAIIVSHVLTGHTISKWLFTFHVPLFFFLSGWLFRQGRDFGPFLKGKLRRLVLPYVALGLCTAFAEAMLQGTGPDFWTRVGQMVLGLVVQRRQWTLWFLPALFLTELAAYWLIRLLHGRLTLCVATAGIAGVSLVYRALGGPVLPWNLDAVGPMLPFFVGGYLLKQWSEGRSLPGKGPKALAAFLLLGIGNLAMGAPSILGKLPRLDVFAGSYGFLPLSYPAAVCGILCVVLVSQWIQPKAVQYLGKNSMIYFAWHQTPVLTAILAWFPRLGIRVSQFPSSAAMMGEKALETLVILLVLTGANALLSRSRARWMLGK